MEGGHLVQRWKRDPPVGGAFARDESPEDVMKMGLDCRKMVLCLVRGCTAG